MSKFLPNIIVEILVVVVVVSVVVGNEVEPVAEGADVLSGHRNLTHGYRCLVVKIGQSTGYRWSSFNLQFCESKLMHCLLTE